MLKSKMLIALLIVVAGTLSMIFFSSEKKEPMVSTFVNPIGSAGADPWVIYKNGYYYGTVTTADDIKIWRAKSLQDLFRSIPTTIWTPKDKLSEEERMYSFNIWAPSSTIWTEAGMFILQRMMGTM